MVDLASERIGRWHTHIYLDLDAEIRQNLNELLSDLDSSGLSSLHLVSNFHCSLSSSNLFFYQHEINNLRNGLAKQVIGEIVTN